MSIQTNKLPDNPQIEVIKSGKTGLFTNYIYKAIPLAFDESMSYYETLCGLLHYLKNVIIPTVNNNADAVAELQSLYEQLRTYVNDYFTNLDVQEEINNKLDEMVKDGTLPEIITSYLNSKAVFGFDNVASMKQATNLINGSYAQTLGFYEKNDGGSALYKIRNITTTDVVDESKIIALSNNLIAELINFTLNREQMMNANHFYVNSNKLTGISKSSRYPINQMEDEISCVDVQYNESLVENIRITNNNNYPDKIGLNLKTPGQRQKIDSVYIGNNFKIGMNIPTAYYSQFNDIWSSGETGVLIGDSNNPEKWIGVLDFNACHFNSSKVAFKEVSIDTNTICIDKSSFEGDIVAIDNAGKIYVRNTYFGDTPDTTEKINCLIARPGSETHFSDCTIGLTSTESVENHSLFDLKSDSNKGSLVYVDGGILNISNNGLCGTSFIYDSDSDKNIIYLDNVEFTPSSTNANHNQKPFKLFNHSPLRSLNPIKNYVVNGTMNNTLLNNIMLSKVSSNAGKYGIDENLINPFGGKVVYSISDNNNSATFEYYYKIPKHLVGKKMCLELYIYSKHEAGQTDVIVHSPNLGVTTYIFNFDKKSVVRNIPVMKRKDVIPQAETGKISIYFHHNTEGEFVVAGVILKEFDKKEYLSCYKDQDIMVNNNKPTVTDGAIKGDIVYNVDTNPTCLGWIFNGTEWIDYTSL